MKIEDVVVELERCLCSALTPSGYVYGVEQDTLQALLDSHKARGELLDEAMELLFYDEQVSLRDRIAKLRDQEQGE